MPGDRFIQLATAEDRHVLDVLFRHASEAVTIQERSGRLLYANDEAALLLGLESGAELVSAPLGEILADMEILDLSGNFLSWDALPGRRVIGGEPYVEEIVGYRLKGAHRAKWSRIHASPIKNDLGEVVFALNFFEDITDQIRRDEEQEVLVTVYEALGSSLDMETNVQALARALVPRVGSWCSVHLIDDAGELIHVATVYSDSEDAHQLRKLSDDGSMTVDDDRVQARVIRSRRPEIIEEITEPMLDEFEKRSGSAAARVLRDLRLSSAACVPLSIGHRVVGTLTLARSLPDTAFDRDDVALLTVIAERVATNLENVRLYERQLVIADTLQNVLMPRFLPTVRSLDVAVRYRPLSLVGHVGGDFYDVLSLGDKRCAILVGDIAGKGIAAAAAVGLARHTLRATIALEPSPTTVISQVNEALLEEDRMCTLAYVLLEHGDGGWQMSVTLAGHPPPIVVRTNGEVLRVGRPCPPVGVLPHLEPIEVEVHLAPGDMAIMYTDGFSLPGLTPPESVELALSKCTAGTTDALLDEMLDVLYGGPEQGRDPADDVALLAFKVAST